MGVDACTDLGCSGAGGWGGRGGGGLQAPIPGAAPPQLYRLRRDTHTPRARPQLDFIQTAVIQFPERPGKPVMGIERLIVGDYVKYNRWVGGWVWGGG